VLCCCGGWKQQSHTKVQGYSSYATGGPVRHIPITLHVTPVSPADAFHLTIVRSRFVPETSFWRLQILFAWKQPSQSLAATAAIAELGYITSHITACTRKNVRGGSSAVAAFKSTASDLVNFYPERSRDSSLRCTASTLLACA
jgi:hypothetical protein